METRKDHWEKIYSSRQPHEISWTEELPKTSLEFIHRLNLSKSASIIDVGAGDSQLVDNLLSEGFHNITLLDISEKALDKTRQRLGDKAAKVKWVAGDITEFHPRSAYDLWHDRATFHFLTSPGEIQAYLSIARQAVRGYLIIGTFSDQGPKKCSGITVRTYREEELQQQLADGFKKIKCVTVDHVTPFRTKQNFLFCSFRRFHN